MAYQEKILFTDIEEVIKYASVPKSTPFESLSPKIKVIQDRHILPILGSDEMTSLLSAYSSSNGPSAQQDALIEKIRYPVANLALLMLIPEMNITMGHGGLSVKSGENFAPAAQWRVNDLKKSLSINGQNGLDALLAFLEDNSSDYPDYDISEERDLAMANFVNTTKEINTYLSIEINRYVLLRMRPVMRRIEETLIKNTLCADLYDDMKDNIVDRDDLGVYAPLLPLVQRAVSHLTFAEAIEELGIRIDENGMYLQVTTTDQTTDHTEAVEGTAMYALAERNKKMGIDAMAALKAELNDNAASYPLYENSPCYNADGPTILEAKEGSGLYPGFGPI